MSSASVSHRRTHNLLLASKLLNLRDSASPLTLILDSLEQPAVPVLKEYIRRAKVCEFLLGPNSLVQVVGLRAPRTVVQSKRHIRFL